MILLFVEKAKKYFSTYYIEAIMQEAGCFRLSVKQHKIFESTKFKEKCGLLFDRN